MLGSDPALLELRKYLWGAYHEPHAGHRAKVVRAPGAPGRAGNRTGDDSREGGGSEHTDYECRSWSYIDPV